MPLTPLLTRKDNYGLPQTPGLADVDVSSIKEEEELILYLNLQFHGARMIMKTNRFRRNYTGC